MFNISAGRAEGACPRKSLLPQLPSHVQLLDSEFFFEVSKGILGSFLCMTGRAFAPATSGTL